MTLAQLLTQLGTAGGAGAAVFALIALVEKFLPPGQRLSGNQKFYAAMALAFILPPLAFAGEVALGLAPASADGLVQAVAVAYMVSQGIHRQVSATDPPRAAN